MTKLQLQNVIMLDDDGNDIRILLADKLQAYAVNVEPDVDGDYTAIINLVNTPAITFHTKDYKKLELLISHLDMVYQSNDDAMHVINLDNYR